MKALVKELEKYPKLSKMDKFNIVNTLPQVEVDYHLLIQNVDFKLTEDEIKRQLPKLIAKYKGHK